MSDEADRIRNEMQNVRQEMGHEVKGILDGAKQLSDWRFYVRQRPWACVGGAFALGFFLSPARKRLLDPDAKRILAQLRDAGALPRSLAGAAPAASGGMLASVLALVGPYVARNAASMLAQRFAAGGAAHRPQNESVNQGEPK